MCADKNGFKNAFLHISHRANLVSKAFHYCRNGVKYLAQLSLAPAKRDDSCARNYAQNAQQRLGRSLRRHRGRDSVSDLYRSRAICVARSCHMF
jgi:hypothetical protein